MVLMIITAFMAAFYAVLIGYYHYHWRRLPLFSSAFSTPSTFLSVIVAARNEEKTLPQLLKALQGQSYPQHLFEIIIVDDFSTDNTSQVAKAFGLENLKVIQPNVDVNASTKKKAIETGVHAATGELIVITDADCIPGVEWLYTIESFYKKNDAVFIAAPVKFSHNNSLLQLFQSMDFLTLQGITAASVGAQFHSMCNGANLAYTQKAFENVGGFAGIDNIASGDDMLLMHKIWKQHPEGVHYLKSKDAIVNTQPMQTWHSFIMQRRRWASKTTHYDDKRVFAVLLFVYLFNCLFLLLLIASFLNPFYWWGVVSYLFVKTIIEWPFVSDVAKFYGEQKLMPYFPFLQPLHIFYTISVGFISQLGKYEWKGRRTK